MLYFLKLVDLTRNDPTLFLQTANASTVVNIVVSAITVFRLVDKLMHIVH